MPARPLPPAGLLQLVATARSSAGELFSGVYLHGSYAAGDAVYGSDADFAVLLSGEPRQDAIARVERECRVAASRLPVVADVLVARADDLLRMGAPWLRGRSVCLAGDDLRARLAHPPTAEYVRRFVEHVHDLVARGRGPLPADGPLPPRDGADPFLGYLDRVMKGPGGQPVPSTQGLVSRGLKLAAARAGMDGRLPRDDCRRANLADSRASLPGHWADTLDELVAFCRTRWEFRVPRESEDRATVARLCCQVSALETEFVHHYRAWRARVG